MEEKSTPKAHLFMVKRNEVATPYADIERYHEP